MTFIAHVRSHLYFPTPQKLTTIPATAMTSVPRVLNKICNFYQKSKLAEGKWNALKFVYLRLTQIHFPRVMGLKLKQMPHALLVRPGTTDFRTLIGAFHAGYHRPPIQMPDHPVILDLGSNVGYTIAEMAAMFPSARIIGVELDRDNHALAVKNTRPFGERCTVIHGAVWKSDGRISYTGSDADAFHIDTSASAGEGRNSVSAFSIASLRRQFGLSRVDYLKMDIEGAETDILQDSTEWTEGVASMKIETHRPGDLERLIPLLEKAGFKCKPCDQHWASLVAIRP